MRKTTLIILTLLCICMAAAAQDNAVASANSLGHNHSEDSTDVFFRHLDLNEVTVTGVTGDTKLKHTTAPVSVVTSQVLRSTAATNIIDAIAHQPGVSQLTTGGSISKPIIRGLGYNRVVVMSEGVRQEGQQWGDEHGVEVDGGSVGSVEILKGPASLMYGSDAMAGISAGSNFDAYIFTATNSIGLVMDGLTVTFETLDIKKTSDRSKGISRK